MDRDNPAFQFASIGMEFAFVFLAFIFAGYWLGKKYGWHPWGLLVGVAIGIPVAFYRLLLQVKIMQRELGNSSTDNKSGDGDRSSRN